MRLVRSPRVCNVAPSPFAKGDDMHRIVRSGEIEPSPGGTVTFEGEAYGSGVSLFLVNSEPGAGPGLHRHPYAETWVLRSGAARFTADGEELDAGPGDIVVVGPETPHKFENSGTGRLEIVCIHASAVFIQEDLEE
jgi:mannose-6-phosphate isomerase-like protein (cupin superfamily)